MRNNRVVSIAIVLGLLIVVVTFIGAAKMVGDDKSDKDGAPSAVSVSRASGVVVFGYVDVNNGPGLLQIFPETFPQSSKVVKIHFKEGDDVKKDDLLIQFDVEPSEFKVAQAQAGLEKASAAQAGTQAKLSQAKLGEDAQKFAIAYQQLVVQSKEAEVRAAQIELDHQKDNASRVGASNDSGLRAAEQKLLSANRALDAEKKKIEGLEKVNPVTAKIDEAQAGVSEAKAAVTIQQSQLGEAAYYKKLMSLRAPSDGRIVRSLVAEGMSFGPHSRMPAFLFQPKGQIIVRAEVDQEWASRVALGQNAKIQDDSNPELKWNGKVIHVSDCFLPKRSSSMTPDVFGASESRVLECIVSVDAFDPKSPLRVGQKLKVSIGFD